MQSILHRILRMTSLFDDKELQYMIANNIADPWEDTPLRGYVHLSPKQKGTYGEHFASKLLVNEGFNVQKRLKGDTSTAGYDRIVEGKKVEVKFSLAIRDPSNKNEVIQNKFIMNHVSKNKDWDILLFIGVNTLTDLCILWFTRDDFDKHLQGPSTPFNVQQGGEKIKNDDYMCTDVLKLMQLPFVHTGLQDLPKQDK